MAKANLYSTSSAKVGSVALPKEFGAAENMTLLAQAVRVYEDARHPRNAVKKTRAEVNVSRRKMYKQKHTGRARHGAKSAPIFVGGGVAHGPRGIKQELTLPKKMKAKALAVSLSVKAKRGRVVVVSDIKKIDKTKAAKALLDKIFKAELAKKVANSTVVLSDKNKEAKRFFRNISSVSILDYKNLNAYDIFRGGLILIDQDVFEKKAVTVKKK